MTQAELARRVGLAQPTIFQLINRGKKGSTRLHLIARELRTTPAYLSGETDDPTASEPSAPDLSADQRELLALFNAMDDASRRSLLHVARSMGAPPPEPKGRAPKLAFAGQTGKS